MPCSGPIFECEQLHRSTLSSIYTRIRHSNQSRIDCNSVFFERFSISQQAFFCWCNPTNPRHQTNTSMTKRDEVFYCRAATFSMIYHDRIDAQIKERAVDAYQG